jgi:hypothetical protein
LRALAGVIAVAALCLLVWPSLGRAETLPAGFDDRAVVSGVSDATAFAFVPDGRILVTSQLGDNTLFATQGLFVP